jgi:hypothetical protein
MFNGIIEIAICMLHDKRKDIAGFTTSETFVKIAIHRDFKRWRFFVVKWAIPDIIRTGFF